MRWAFAILLSLAGCGRDRSPSDLGADAAAPPDLAPPSDLAPPPDLAQWLAFGTPFHSDRVDGVTSLVLGDFDGDGKLDAAAGGSVGYVAVFPGLGDGTLFAPKWLGMWLGPVSIAGADLDGDGKTDLNVMIPQDHGYGWLRGVPGGFASDNGVYGSTYTPTAQALADFDSKLGADLAIAYPDTGSIRILLSNGVVDAGLWSLGTDLAIAATSVLATGDLDGDGKTDLVAAGGGTLTVFPGHGDGSFGAPRTSPWIQSPTVLLLADLDDDGALDAAIGDSTSPWVEVRRGDGAGGFGLPAAYPLPASTSSLAAADLDGDGHLDLAAACPLANQVVVLGGPAFAPIAAVTLVRPTVVAAGDFDGDGRLDLIAGEPLANDLAIALRE